MVAGISGSTPGSATGGGWDEVRLMLPQAPKNIASAEASESLATVRV
jgi:hypothetical protein